MGWVVGFSYPNQTWPFTIYKLVARVFSRVSNSTFPNSSVPIPTVPTPTVPIPMVPIPTVPIQLLIIQLIQLFN